MQYESRWITAWKDNQRPLCALLTSRAKFHTQHSAEFVLNNILISYFGTILFSYVM